MDRPNILLIMTDEQCAHAMSCTGDRHVKTPAMDALARRGVRHELAYATQPLCIPFRTAMQTGYWPHQIGVRVNNQNANANAAHGRPMIGRVMRDAGYDCAYFGKWHIAIHCEAKGWHISVEDDDAPAHGYVPADCCYDREIPDRVRAFLAADRDKPFFLTTSFMNPHDCIELSDGRPLPQGDVRPLPPPELCPPLPDNFAVPDDEPSVIREVQRRYPQSYPVTHWTEDQWRQYLWGYYRLVEMVDGQIGQVLDALDAAGHADDTVILFTADHGDGASHHQWNQKQTLYDESARVPMIAVTPRLTRRGTVDTEHLLCPGIDLFPTLLDYAGVHPPADLPGRSLRPLLDGPPAADWRTEVVCETLFGTGMDISGIEGRMVRTKRHKYVVYNRGERREQLFDMTADPGEMTNLAACPDMQAVLDEHRRRLAQWCRDTDDHFDGLVTPTAGSTGPMRTQALGRFGK